MALRSIFSALLIVTLLFIPLDAMAGVILSEVQITGAKASDEFIELYNDGDAAVNLSGWSLRRKSAGDTTTKGSSLKTFGGTDTIPAHSYFLWANSASIYKDLADATTGSSLADNNSLALYDESGTLVDSLTWGTGHTLPYSPTQFDNPDAKESFMRDTSSLAWAETKSPTPTNSKGEVFVNTSGTAETGASPYIVLINEVLPNPKEKSDAGEFIELYNPSTDSIDLSGWEIHDASVTGKYTFPSGTTIPSLGYLVVTDQDFSLSLNNSNETLSLFDKEKRLVHRVSYVKTKEGVSLNLVGTVLRGARKPTPGAANEGNTDPVTKERVPKKGYRGFTTEFRAHGKDTDSDKLKFTWDFGDGHKSYKENTSHKYLKSGRYTVTLTTDDGIDTTTETFEIKIEKYEPPKVRIVSFAPNPVGNDSELEWIEIENREKREVNLKDFSIATGTKKKSITNHPIREDFIISPKSVKRLTREYSLFTLGNERGHIELRAPDGTVLQHLKYKFDKSLPDNVVLKKEKGKALALVSVPVESSESETSTTSPEAVSETPVASPSEGVAPESAPEAEVKPETVVYPSESAASKRFTWAEVASYGTPFSLPESFVLKVSAAPIPASEALLKNENTPLEWRDAVNAFLNRLVEKFL